MCVTGLPLKSVSLCFQRTCFQRVTYRPIEKVVKGQAYLRINRLIKVKKQKRTRDRIEYLSAMCAQYLYATLRRLLNQRKDLFKLFSRGRRYCPYRDETLSFGTGLLGENSGRDCPVIFKFFRFGQESTKPPHIKHCGVPQHVPVYFRFLSTWPLLQ